MSTGSPDCATLQPMADPSDSPSSPVDPGARPHRRAHTTARDLERYSGLFAERTRVMR